ncbi:hypothetical protein F4860DRAFT_232968 [Xylaria cubensis]|nr:hypothetical protein F4860DRAFT_232968 [Xylaria cubensis]
MHDVQGLLALADLDTDGVGNDRPQKPNLDGSQATLPLLSHSDWSGFANKRMAAYLSYWTTAGGIRSHCGSLVFLFLVPGHHRGSLTSLLHKACPNLSRVSRICRISALILIIASFKSFKSRGMRSFHFSSPTHYLGFSSRGCHLQVISMEYKAGCSRNCTALHYAPSPTVIPLLSRISSVPSNDKLTRKPVAYAKGRLVVPSPITVTYIHDGAPVGIYVHALRRQCPIASP